MTDTEQAVYDPDFTEEEHREFEKLEAEQPYREVCEEKIRVPVRPAKTTDTRHDLLYLGLFCILMAIFLVIIVITGFM